jgi:O-antigen/teichoic acid export membrane protein
VAVNLLLMHLRADRQIGRYVSLLVGESAAYLVLVAAAAACRSGLGAVLVALLGLKLTMAAVCIGLLRRQRVLAWPTFSCLRVFLGFSLPLLPLGILSWVNNIGDRYVIGAFHGPEAVAVYSVSYALASLVGLCFAPVFFALEPAITEAWEANRHDQIGEYLRYAQKYPLMAAVPIAAAITVLNGVFIRLLGGAGYLASPAIVGLVACGIILMNMSALAETVVRLSGPTHVFPLYYGACALFNVAINIALVPSLGYSWAAAVTLATYGLQLALMHRCVVRRYAFRWEAGIIGRIAAAGLAMAACLYPFRVQAPPVQLVGLVLGGLGYIGCLALLGVFERREWRLVRELVGRGVG